MTETAKFSPRGKRGKKPAPSDMTGEVAQAMPCPITAVGQRAGIYYFIGASGELREMDVRALTALGLISLCDGDPRWLIETFRKHDAQGNPQNDFHPRQAAAGLIAMAARAGIFDPDTPIRGVGVWRHEDRLVIHAGDALLLGERWEPPGQRIGNAIYPASFAVARPSEMPATERDGAILLRAYRLWRYVNPIAPRLLFGWTALGMLGSAPPWRAHIMPNGERGTGKSWLAKLTGNALGAQARWFNNFSAAGVQGVLSNEARAIVLDEAEGESGRVQQVIELLRQMSGDDGAVGVRGTAAGGSRRFAVSSAAYLSAINPPQLLPQDRSRITEIQLQTSDPQNEAAAKTAIEWAAAHSPALRARMIRAWPRFLPTLGVYRSLLIEAGCDGRQADQLGALLAAGDLMLHDMDVDSDSAAELIDELRPMIYQIRAEDEEDSNPRQCFGHLMSRQVEHWSGGSKSTLGRIVQHALADDGATAREALPVHGLRLDRHGGQPCLLVANRHGGLDHIFRDSRWKDGAWKTALLHLPGSRVWEPVNFAGHKSRCVMIDAQHLPLLRQPDAPPPVAGAPPDMGYDVDG